MVGKPFQRIPNGSAVDDPGADTTHAVPKIQAGDGLGSPGSNPTQRDEDRANTQHQPGSDSIDQISFKRYEPGLQGNEQSERPLNGDQRNVQVRLYRFGKQRPGILQVGDSHHRNDAGYELDPAVGNTRRVNQSVRRCSHGSASFTALDVTPTASTANNPATCSAGSCIVD